MYTQVYYKQADAKFFPAFAFAFAQSLVFYPLHITEGVVFATMAYWSAGLSGYVFVYVSIYVSMYISNMSIYINMYIYIYSFIIYIHVYICTFIHTYIHI
jgi:hypothetical protein